MKDIIAIIAGIVSVSAAIPYLRDTYLKKTKPNIVSWFTWALLTGIATAAALAAGEPRTAILTFASTLVSAAIVILGLRYGIAKFGVFDALCQIGAVIGLILWIAFDSPALGIIVPVAIDFIALLPTLRHAWVSPNEETWQAFFYGVIAAGLTMVSLSRYNVASLLYPLYLLLADATLTIVIVGRRRRNLLQ